MPSGKRRVQALQGRLTDTTTVTLEVLIERKHPEMAAFIVVPAAAVSAWKLAMTTTIEGTLDGIPIGRRSLVRWDDKRWFVELKSGSLEAIGKSAGDRATLAITVASAALPPELQTLIDTNPGARARWEAHTSAQQRMIREEILSAMSSAARER